MGPAEPIRPVYSAPGSAALGHRQNSCAGQKSRAGDPCGSSAGNLPIYPIKERKDSRHLVLIVCNTKFDHLPPRNGVNFDITGMKGLLQGLGYTVVEEKNLTARNSLNNLVKKRVLKLKEKEKKKDYNTKIEGKALFLTDYMLKNYVAGQTSIQTLPNMDKKSTNIKETGFHYIGQAVHKLLTSGDAPTQPPKLQGVCVQ
ncbi:Caspase-5, partial [Plecturocebus cupreus]